MERRGADRRHGLPRRSDEWRDPAVRSKLPAELHPLLDEIADAFDGVERRAVDRRAGMSSSDEYVEPLRAMKQAGLSVVDAADALTRLGFGPTAAGWALRHTFGMSMPDAHHIASVARYGWVLSSPDAPVLEVLAGVPVTVVASSEDGRRVLVEVSEGLGEEIRARFPGLTVERRGAD